VNSLANVGVSRCDWQFIIITHPIANVSCADYVYNIYIIIILGTYMYMGTIGSVPTRSAAVAANDTDQGVTTSYTIILQVLCTLPGRCIRLLVNNALLNTTRRYYCIRAAVVGPTARVIENLSRVFSAHKTATALLNTYDSTITILI